MLCETLAHMALSCSAKQKRMRRKAQPHPFYLFRSSVFDPVAALYFPYRSHEDGQVGNPIDAQITVQVAIHPMPDRADSKSQAVGDDVEILCDMSGIPPDIAIGPLLVLVLRPVHDGGPHKVDGSAPRHFLFFRW